MNFKTLLCALTCAFITQSQPAPYINIFDYYGSIQKYPMDSFGVVFGVGVPIQELVQLNDEQNQRRQLGIINDERTNENLRKRIAILPGPKWLIDQPPHPAQPINSLNFDMSNNRVQDMSMMGGNKIGNEYIWGNNNQVGFGNVGFGNNIWPTFSDNMFTSNTLNNVAPSWSRIV